MKRRRTALILATLIWMGLIFYMSAQNADTSEETSGRVVRVIEHVFFSGWDELPAEEYEARHQSLTYLVRKMAHFTEYLILGVFLSMVLATYQISWKLRVLAAAGTGVLYAVTDELHQIFSEGRAMSVFDMLIDSSGVILGVLAALGIAAMKLMEKNDKG